MWCDKFKCTLSTDACIKRRSIRLTSEMDREYGHSLKVCRECMQGEAVINNPNGFINRDCKMIAKKYIKSNKNGDEDGKRKRIHRKTINRKRTG